MRNKLRTWFWNFHSKHICIKKLSFVNWFFDLRPDKYCWADCVSWAYSPDRFNPFKIDTSEGCKTESMDHNMGTCYCGGWANGVCWHTLSKEKQEAIRAEGNNSPDIVLF